MVRPMASETMIMMILDVAKSQSDVNIIMKYIIFTLKELHPETPSLTYIKSIALPGFTLPIEARYLCSQGHI